MFGPAIIQERDELLVVLPSNTASVLRSGAMAWGTGDIPDLAGTTALVTGSNTGIGLETAAALAMAGAHTVLACRNVDKAEVARAEIEGRGARGEIEILKLDLASQSQIADAAAEALERFPRIDRLVNNAGVMADRRLETEEGHELLFGTNHLGHFAFTGLILPAILAAPSSRIVTVTSLSQKVGRLRWHDLHQVDGYRPLVAYAQSKLANITFAVALQKRLAGAAADTGSLVAHPGFAATDILRGHHRQPSQLEHRLAARFVQTPADASRPSLRAATDPSAYGGEFYGPSRFEVHGPPVPVRPSRRALDEEEQERLWDVSVEHTGVEYPLTEPFG